MWVITSVLEPVLSNPDLEVELFVQAPCALVRPGPSSVVLVWAQQ